MLIKEDIIKILREANLPESEYWITAGAGMVMHGVKEQTRDIDLGCTADLFTQLLGKGHMCIYKGSDRIIQLGEFIELIENWSADKIDIIEGLPVASLDSIRKQKEILGREKDLKDIALIDEFVKLGD